MEENLNQEECLKELPELISGMRLEVISMKNCLIFMGKIDWVKDDTIQLVHSAGGELPYIEYNSTIKLRGFWQGQPVFMKGVIRGSTKRFWRIDQLHTLQISEQRGYFRQNVKLGATIMCVNEVFEEGAEEDAEKRMPVPCEIANISAGGVMVLSKGNFREGDWVYVMNMALLPDENPLAFTCIVRRVIDKGKQMEYGCEFCDLEDQERERLIQSILKLQRIELRLRRENLDD